MATQEDNPYLSPVEIADEIRQDNRRWSRTVKLLLIGTVLLLLAFGFFGIGFTHYSYLASGFDYENQSSRELAQQTESAFYWIFPTVACFCLGVVFIISAAIFWVVSLLRG